MKKLLLVITLFSACITQAQTKIESTLFESYDQGAWITNGGYNYTYDSNNNLLSETYYSLQNTVWTAQDKLNYTYNTNNKVVTETSLNWDNDQFVNNYKSTYTYNAANKPILILNETWNGNMWVIEGKTDITYNGNLLLAGISKIWDGSQYVNDYKTTATYTGNNPTLWLNEQWNGTQWVIDYRTILTYNANNKIINYKTEIWDGTTWEEQENSSTTLSTNGNRLQQINSFEGDLSSKQEYNYDTNALMSNFGHPFKDKTGLDYIFEDFPYVNKILNEVYSVYDGVSASYILSGRSTYNYTNALPLSTDNFQLKTVTLFPNPTINSFELSGLKNSESISIYNVLGHKVFEATIEPNQKVDIQNLANGLYFLKFDTDKTIKFLKE